MSVQRFFAVCAYAPVLRRAARGKVVSYAVFFLAYIREAERPSRGERTAEWEAQRFHARPAQMPRVHARCVMFRLPRTMCCAGRVFTDCSEISSAHRLIGH